MRTTVVCGLLGSGKTTFIKNRLKNNGERTVVLVNDFGAAGIDGEIFSAGGVHSVELPSGCVCCTLKLDLVTTVRKIVEEFSPEHLMIEPSGVASPAGVLEALDETGIEGASVIGVVDVTEFAELYRSGMYGGFFEEQIVNSDVILVNKTDLAEEEKIREAVCLIESINPKAVLLRSVNAYYVHTAAEEPRSGLKELRRRNASLTDGHFNFETLSLRLPGVAGWGAVSNFFNDLARGRYGCVIRAKGLIKTGQGPCRCDLAFGKIDCVSFERDVDDSRIVVIGQELDAPGMQRAAERMCS